jgi:hypothetical protein
VLYHMTVFQVSKWALKKIDRIRRRFLWHGVKCVGTEGSWPFDYGVRSRGPSSPVRFCPSAVRQLVREREMGD